MESMCFRFLPTVPANPLWMKLVASRPPPPLVGLVRFATQAHKGRGRRFLSEKIYRFAQAAAVDFSRSANVFLNFCTFGATTARQ
jgi:hypothetical protein